MIFEINEVSKGKVEEGYTAIIFVEDDIRWEMINSNLLRILLEIIIIFARKQIFEK